MKNLTGDYLTIREAAKVLNRSVGNVYALAQQGRLGSVKLGWGRLIPKEALVEFVAACGTTSVPESARNIAA